MTAQILDGKQTAEALLAEVKQRLATCPVQPGLAVVQVGNDPASAVYVKKKAQMAQQLGIHSRLIQLPATTTHQELEATIVALNNDPAVHAILLQLPLPKHLNAAYFQQLTAPHKDVDGFHPLNLGLLLSGQKPAAVPCTPAGVMWMLSHYNLPLVGKHAVVIGRSNIVGKPQAQLLLAQNATVTIAHSQTQDLPGLCRTADILVAAVGKAEMVKTDWVKPGAVVIDVGINRLTEGERAGKLVGDVAFEEVAEVAGWITPVPGGVGPLTIAMLMQNTVALANILAN